MQPEYDILAAADHAAAAALLECWWEAQCAAKSAVTRRQTAHRRMLKAVAAFRAAEAEANERLAEYQQVHEFLLAGRPDLQRIQREVQQWRERQRGE